MKRYALLLCVMGILAACAAPQVTPQVQTPPPPGPVPTFATVPFAPFNRLDTIAIAMREWRLFGQKVEDEPADLRPVPLPEDKPERQPGLWQRVGEYWWIGIAAPAGQPGPRDPRGQP